MRGLAKKLIVKTPLERLRERVEWRRKCFNGMFGPPITREELNWAETALELAEALETAATRLCPSCSKGRERDAEGHHKVFRCLGHDAFTALAKAVEGK